MARIDDDELLEIFAKYQNEATASIYADELGGKSQDTEAVNYSEEWLSGGMQGGDGWRPSEEKIEPEEEPEFKGLIDFIDELSERLGMRFSHCLDLKSLSKRKYRYVSEHNGNYSQYATNCIDLSDVKTHLRKLGYLNDKLTMPCR